MERADLDGCFRLLEAYYPGDWSPERVVVWADALRDLDPIAARDAIRRMGQTEKFATVAALLETVNGKQPRYGEPVTIPGRGTFLPGSGWVRDYTSNRELGEG